MKNTNKITKWLIRIGAILLIMGIICSIVIGIGRGAVEDYFGMKPSTKMLREGLPTAASMAKMFGTSLSELLGISGFLLFLLRFSLAMQIWLLVIGGLSLAAGILLKKFGGNVEVEKAKASLSHGVSAVSSKVKETVDHATVKCPTCGKISTGKSAFCANCGTKLPEKKPPEKRITAIVCKNCGASNEKSAKFCSNCGAALEVPVETKNICSRCGIENKQEAKFCCSCGASLTIEAKTTDTSTPGIMEAETFITEKTEVSPVAVKEAPASVVEEPVLSTEETPVTTLKSHNYDVNQKNAFLKKPTGL